MTTRGQTRTYVVLAFARTWAGDFLLSLSISGAVTRLGTVTARSRAAVEVPMPSRWHVAAARTDWQCQAILAKHRTKGQHDRVTVSHVARKLVHILYAVLTHERPYTVPAAYATTPDAVAEVLVYP